MKKLNRAVIIISKIVEVFMWVGCGLSAILTGICWASKFELMKYFTDARVSTPMLAYGDFSLRTQDASGHPVQVAFVIFFLTLVFTMALMAMCARNVHLIFKTAEGKTRFSKGATPFQPDNVRMVREIGIFLIAIPVVKFLFSVIARIVLPDIMVEPDIDMEGLFMGLVVLALSQYFAYGMQLERDVDGLV